MIVLERETCVRCGASWDVTKKRSKERVLCQSCRTRRSITITHGEFKCMPWHGRFSDDMVTPIDDNGDEVLPGKRLCSMLDCINPNHIE